MRYHWSGQRDGHLVCGEMRAPSVRTARLRLLLYGVEVADVCWINPFTAWLQRRRIADELPRTVRQMALLAGAGLPIHEVVRLLRQQAGNPGLSIAFSRAEEGLMQGHSPAQAFAAVPELNDSALITGLRAGQASGRLAQLLNVLAQSMKVRDDLRRKLRRALAYPLLLLGTAVGVSLLTLLWLVPLYAELYQDHSRLPASTLVLFAISEGLSEPRWWLLLCTPLLLLALLRLPRLAHWRSRLMLATPLLGHLVRLGLLAQMLQLLALLATARVGLSEALELCRQQTRSPVMAGELGRARARLESGQSPGEAFADASFGTDIAPLMALSERGGNLAEVIQSAADYYAERFGDEVAQALSLLEPLTVLLLGALTGGLLVVLYLPLFSMGQAF